MLISIKIRLLWLSIFFWNYCVDQTKTVFKLHLTLLNAIHSERMPKKTRSGTKNTHTHTHTTELTVDQLIDAHHG